MDSTAQITVVPANEASWQDLKLVFGQTGDAASCQCQWFQAGPGEFGATPLDVKRERLRAQTNCDHPEARTTTGLVAYLDGEPVGWCTVQPRTNYVRLLRNRVPWTGRHEDTSDDGVWSVTCFVVRKGFRNRGVSRALAAATVDFARARGATAVEGYPMVVEPGKEVIWGQLYVGSLSIFADAGYAEVSTPTPRRVVMRVDF
jgi:GNAT superfamily N-acetyltransferase